MKTKIIRLPINAKAQNAYQLFKNIGYECVKLSIDRRYQKRQKVISAIRNHSKYKETFEKMLMFEGIISILTRKEFWIGSPDFIIWNDEELYFCEFKAKNDVFRLNQLDWFERFEALPTAIAFAVLKKSDTIK